MAFAALNRRGSGAVERVAVASGIARRPPRPEFAATFKRDFGDPTPDVASGCKPTGPAPHHPA